MLGSRAESITSVPEIIQESDTEVDIDRDGGKESDRIGAESFINIRD